jgi:ABC-type glycerol-3-phosphate transport system substrate-binding protein
MKIKSCTHVSLIFWSALVMLSQTSVYAKQNISVAVLAINKQQISLFADQFRRFNESQSEIVVSVDFYSDQGHKSKISGWLESGEYDLIHWQAGKRLNDFVDQELLLPIDSLIDKKTLVENVSSQLLDVVDIKGSYQALPFGYYPWGFYFNKAIFTKYSLSPPKSWPEFLAICKKLKEQGVAPLVQANQEGWPLLAWIDYLALDNGGITTRQEMTEYASVSRANVEKIVEQFSMLLEFGYFFAPDHSWRWEQTITLLRRQQAAMTLIGQFAESEIQPEYSSQIGFFPFPHSQLDEQYPAVAPIDLFMVPLASKNHAYLRGFLDFLIQPATNKLLATGLGFLPVFPQFDGQGLSERASIGLQSLRESSTLVQYFDRDTEKQYATNLANSIAQSILNGESSVFKGALLGQDFIRSTEQTVNFGLSEKFFNFSSFTGSRGTFFASNVLSAVYKKLGYNIAVTRYANLEETLGSFRFGADGELVRAEAFGGQSKDLIQVPEPLIETSLYLVCRNSEVCARKLRPNERIGRSMNAVVLKDWWKQENVVPQDYLSTVAMLNEYTAGQLDYMVLSAIDLAAYNEELGNSSYRSILTIPFYHFIHKKHQKLLESITQELKSFKQTPEYQFLQKRFWLN